MDFSGALVRWYKYNKRDLPWRRTTNPYYIWLSEVILQQTRVSQGLPYYIDFLDTFPKVEDLAYADEDKVLKMWQGLGYYSRARNLHYTAKEVVVNYSGEFPKDYDKILKLKGVGLYTAAAIVSFAFNMPYAVVDGNVIRLLSRFFGIDIPFDTLIGKKRFNELAYELLIKQKPALYNQAIMEFGALQCTPKSPNCFICPLQDSCHAYSLGMVGLLPIKLKKTKVSNRFLHFLVISCKGYIYLGKREKGIWRGLYDFPFLEFKERINQQKVLKSLDWNNFFGESQVNIISISEEFLHVLSHQKIYARFWHLEINEISLEDYQLVLEKDLLSFPVSRLIEKYFESIQ
tara:strand:+ start:3609 stop:4646 length:1038 start_codon:yes stop_codon:yes gene_type:complete